MTAEEGRLRHEKRGGEGRLDMTGGAEELRKGRAEKGRGVSPRIKNREERGGVEGGKKR